MNDIQVARSVPCAPRQAFRRAGTRMTVYPPATELADDMMRDLICAWAASMVENKPTVTVEGEACQDTTEFPPLRRREQWPTTDHANMSLRHHAIC